MQGQDGSVRSIMTTDIVTVLPNTPIVEVSRIMLQKHIRCVLVCDEDRNLKGIITDSDLVFGTAGKGQKGLELSVSEMMTEDPASIGPNADIYEAVAVMSEKSCRRVPVVKDGRVIGIISIRDVIRSILKNMGSRKIG